MTSMLGYESRYALLFFLITCLPLPVAAETPDVRSYAVLRDSSIEVFYVPEARAEAEDVLRILAAAIADLAPRLPLGEEPVRVVIPQTLAEFARFAPDYSHVSVEGVAHSHTGWMIVKSRALHRPDSSFPGTLRHELVHVLLARNTALGNLPRWLNEGIAMTLAGELHWSAPFRVTRMQATGDVIPYAHLDFAFQSGEARVVHNAYAQSLSMTDYLMDKLGEARFWEMVASLQHQSFGKAVQEYMGLTPLAFWEAWRRSLWGLALAVSLMSGFTAFQVMAALLVLGYLRKRRQARLKLAQWEAEEAEDGVFTVWDLENQDPAYPWEDDDDERS